MFKKVLSIFAATVLLAGGLTGLVVPAASADATGGSPTMLITKSTTPATDWASQATPIGNGRIGGMIFGGVDSDQIEINEDTLWTGGPGPGVNYDGGQNSLTPAQRKANLQTLRQKLQDSMTAFSNNPANAPVQNGNTWTAGNYGVTPYINTSVSTTDKIYESQDIVSLIQSLQSGKPQFGSYQALGFINLDDPSKMDPKALNISSNAEPTSGAEGSANLFDGNGGSKFYAGNAAKQPPNYPVTVNWNYNLPLTFSQYILTSGNDTPTRDPKEWHLWGSPDGTADSWVLVDHQLTTANSWARSTPYAFNLTGGAVSYSYFRLDIDSTWGAASNTSDSPQLSEIKLVNANVSATVYSDYTRILDLNTAVATTSYVAGGVTYTREYFTSAPGDFMAIKLTADQPGSITRRISLSTLQTQNLKINTAGNTITMTGQPSPSPGTAVNSLIYAENLQVINTGGTLTPNPDGVTGAIDVTGADSVVILMSCGTNYISDPARLAVNPNDYFTTLDTPTVLAEVSDRVTAAAAQSYDTLKADHIADYSALFSRVKLDLGGNTLTDAENISTDKLIAGYNKTGGVAGANTAAQNRYVETLLYQFGRYLLISSSRDALPANLQGLWCDGLAPPWSADYHTNINLQMNYWLAEQTNLSECHIPMINYINGISVRATQGVSNYYVSQTGGPVRGWAIGHENNIWGSDAPGNWYWGYNCPSAAAWLCQDIWSHYTYTMDADFLNKNFSTMLQAALFWVDNLWTDSRDGTLVSNPSYSPEHGPYSLGASNDQVQIWELFNDVQQAASVLGIDTKDIQDVKAAQDKLYLPQIGKAGEYLEWKDETGIDITGDGGQRHTNHLSGLFPGSLVVIDRSAADDAFQAPMEQVLNVRGDNVDEGWSKAWKIGFWADLHVGNRAFDQLSALLSSNNGKSTNIMPNMLDRINTGGNTFQIDANFGATAGMTQMLLQSQGGTFISLLPAVPAQWSTGSVTGLKAEGDFTVDMSWEQQQLTDLSITSGAGSDCTLNYSGMVKDGVLKATVTKKSDGSKVAATVDDRGMVSFPTVKGETYVITGFLIQKLPDARANILGTSTFNNIYSDAIAAATGIDDGLGAYVQTAPVTSNAAKLGLQVNDVVRSINGNPVADTADFATKYAALQMGDSVTLTVLRQGKEFTVKFSKPSATSAADVVGSPCTLVAAGFNSVLGSPTVVTDPNQIQNVLSANAGDAVSFDSLFFYTSPDNVSLTVSSTAASKVLIYYTTPNSPGNQIAEVDIPNTGGAWQTITAPIDPDNLYSTRSIWLSFDGSVKVAALSLIDGMWGDVDNSGKVDTIDARLVLQYIVNKITSDDLNLAAADVDGNGKVDTVDARLILQKIVNKISQFPVEQ